MSDEIELPVERTSIDVLLTSDYAEVIGGKLLVVGGGWDKFGPPEYPAQMRLGIAAAIRVPFLEANIPHHFSVSLTKGDGGELFTVEGDLETGRSPGSRGESTFVPFAANIITTIEGPQLLELVARVGESTKRVSIRAAEAPTPPTTRRGGGGT